MSKIKELRILLSKLDNSPYQNVIAGNSSIKHKGFGIYQIWCGGMQPKHEDTFDEIKKIIQDEVNYQEEMDKISEAAK